MFVIREAVAADDGAVGELLVDAFVGRYAKKMPEVEVTERRKAELRDVAAKRQVAKVWVADAGGKVVGTVALWPAGAPGSESWVENTTCLRHLAVDEAWAGRGISSALLDAAEAWTRAQGCAGVCLHVRRGALGVARMYERRGYQRQVHGDHDFLPEVFLEAWFLPH